MTDKIAKIKEIIVKIPELLLDHQLKVRFRKVGQGDTIIIESFEDGKLKLGIVDCKNEGGVNPVVSYLNYLKCLEVSYSIRYIIISHPHWDHYSGAAELFKHLTKNNITVEKYCHSMFYHKDYAEVNNAPRAIVAKIKNAVKDLRKKQKLFREGGIPCMASQRFTGKISIVFFEPEGKSITEFIEKTDNVRQGRTSKENLPNPNMLSTIIAITNGNEYVLLTSDAEKHTFNVLDQLIDQELPGQRLFAAQIPHHGADLNFNRIFWKKINFTWKQINPEEKTPAILSVGDKDRNHPSGDVLKDLREFGYQCLETSKPGTQLYTRKKFNSLALLIEESEAVDDGVNDTLVYMPTIKSNINQ